MNEHPSGSIRILHALCRGASAVGIPQGVLARRDVSYEEDKEEKEALKKDIP